MAEVDRGANEYPGEPAGADERDEADGEELSRAAEELAAEVDGAREGGEEDHGAEQRSAAGRRTGSRVSSATVAVVSQPQKMNNAASAPPASAP